MLKRIVVGTTIAATSWYAFYRVTRWWHTWGIRPVDSALPLPGDALIETAAESDTRGITIAAPPEAVWPWLLQMGFGRAGWYSYDSLDMKGSSAEAILPELGALAVGDIVPTDPSGGFEVKVLDPGRALVLYVDAAMVAARKQASEGDPAEAVPVGLEASGRFLGTATPPDFAASWLFYLRPEPDGSTRLIERVRLRVGESKGMPKVLAPLLGFGVFVMMQRQMVGIRRRAERLARG